ncbi:protein-disulfide isomerase [Thalassotalea nanhaiensis]|uniref:Protein-disulfide isomerase n=1 Tax=Thalassotalea nanhaiensis TaxID=3065648 RepID=A0ABY9TLX7_9GAMM|nr:protein-disulfide isomerase [Colwelliaceae bacterium SQ345]
MTTELFFIYDSHCPWSYASTALVNCINKAYPDMHIHLWHTAYYEGNDSPGKNAADTVSRQSAANFGMDYIRDADNAKDSYMAANVMAWVQNKQPEKALEVLNALQHQHFVENNPLTDKDDFDSVIGQFKFSPPAKVFKLDLSKDAEYVLGDIAEIQEVIQTTAFPALMLAVDDRLVMLNHNLYLTKPEKIVEAVELELK